MNLKTKRNGKSKSDSLETCNISLLISYHIIMVNINHLIQNNILGISSTPIIKGPDVMKNLIPFFS
jgi:hypothetical protein